MYSLKPIKGPIIVNGSLYYDESDRARTRIRLKKPIVNEFTQLKNFKAKLRYRMEYHRTISTLKKRMKKIENGEEGIPFLLFLYEVKENR